MAESDGHCTICFVCSSPWHRWCGECLDCSLQLQSLNCVYAGFLSQISVSTCLSEPIFLFSSPWIDLSAVSLLGELTFSLNMYLASVKVAELSNIRKMKIFMASPRCVLYNSLDISKLELLEMNLRVKTRTILILLALLTIITHGLAATRMTMIDGKGQMYQEDVMKEVSIQDAGAKKSNLGYPGSSIDNHHIIPRTQFNSNSPPDADDQKGSGVEGAIQMNELYVKLVC